MVAGEHDHGARLSFDADDVVGGAEVLDGSAIDVLRHLLERDEEGVLGVDGAEELETHVGIAFAHDACGFDELVVALVRQYTRNEKEANVRGGVLLEGICLEVNAFTTLKQYGFLLGGDAALHDIVVVVAAEAEHVGSVAHSLLVHEVGDVLHEATL